MDRGGTRLRYAHFKNSPAINADHPTRRGEGVSCGALISTKGQPAGLSVGWFQARLEIHGVSTKSLSKGSSMVADRARVTWGTTQARPSAYSCSRDMNRGAGIAE